MQTKIVEVVSTGELRLTESYMTSLMAITPATAARAAESFPLGAIAHELVPSSSPVVSDPLVPPPASLMCLHYLVTLGSS